MGHGRRRGRYERVWGSTRQRVVARRLIITSLIRDVFERVLRPGESIMIEPGAFLYKDSSVTMNVETQQLTTGFFGGTGMSLARMTGPGRVGIQSMYVHHR